MSVCVCVCVCVCVVCARLYAFVCCVCASVYVRLPMCVSKREVEGQIEKERCKCVCVCVELNWYPGHVLRITIQNCLSLIKHTHGDLHMQSQLCSELRGEVWCGVVQSCGLPTVSAVNIYHGKWWLI